MSVTDNELSVRTLDCNNAVSLMIAKEMQNEKDQNETEEKGLESQRDVANSNTDRKDEERKGNHEHNHQNETDCKNMEDVIPDDKTVYPQLKQASHTDHSETEAASNVSCENVSADSQQTSSDQEGEKSSEFCDMAKENSIKCSKDQLSETELVDVGTGNDDISEFGKSETTITYPQLMGIQQDWICEECSLPFSEYLKQIDQYNRMMSYGYTGNGTISSNFGQTYMSSAYNPFANPMNLQIMAYYNNFPVIPNFVIPSVYEGNQHYPRSYGMNPHRQMLHHFNNNLEYSACYEQSGNGIFASDNKVNAFDGANVEETDKETKSVESNNIDSKGDKDNCSDEKNKENTSVDQEQASENLGENESVGTDDESGSDDEVNLPDKRSTCTSESQSSLTDEDNAIIGRNPIDECVSETCLQNVDDENCEQYSEENSIQLSKNTPEIEKHVVSGQTGEMSTNELEATDESEAGSSKNTPLDSESERKLTEIINMLNSNEPKPIDPNAEDELVIDLNSLIEQKTNSELENNVSYRNTDQCYYPNFSQPLLSSYQYYPNVFPGVMNAVSNNVNGPMPFQQGFGTFSQSNQQIFYPGSYQQCQQFQTPPPSFHFQNNIPPPNFGTNNPGNADQSLLQGQTADFPFQYPAVYFSSVGLLTVLLKYDVAIEMTLDHIIRVVSHQNKVVAATNTRGTCSCIHHPMVKVVQDTTTIDADLFQEWKAQMTTEEISFCNKTKGFKFGYDDIQECNMNFKDLSKDNSVNFLFGQKKFQPDVIPTCIERINNAQYFSMKNGGFTMWLNGVKIMQNERGDVCVSSGPKYLKICPNNTTVKLKTHFVQMSVEADGLCNIIRGVHWLHAKENMQLYLTNGKIEAGFDRNKKVWACVMPHRLPIRIQYQKKSRQNSATKKRDVENR